MATTKPRLQISMSPELAAVIARLAAARSMPRASIVSEVLEAATPQLAQVADVMEMAMRAPQSVHSTLRALLDRATAEIEPITHDALDASQRLQLNLEDAINEAIRRTKDDLAEPTPLPPTL